MSFCYTSPMEVGYYGYRLLILRNIVTFMDGHNELIVRWDNAPHHPHLKTYPHHKHLQEAIENSMEITLEEVLKYIEKQRRP